MVSCIICSSVLYVDKDIIFTFGNIVATSNLDKPSFRVVGDGGTIQNIQLLVIKDIITVV
jgi:hypothetical protein